jgi:hypothetical protein
LGTSNTLELLDLGEAIEEEDDKPQHLLEMRETLEFKKKKICSLIIFSAFTLEMI